MKQLNLILLLLFSLLFTQNAQAQEHFVNGINGNAISSESGTPLAFDGEIKIEDQYYNCSISSTSCPHPYTISQSKLYAKLWFDDALRNYYGSDWKVEVTYSIDLVEQNATATATATTNLLRLNNQKLSIDFHPTMNYKDIDIFVHAASPGFYMVKATLMVTNVSITKQDGTPIATNPFGTNLNLADDIHLDVNLEMTRAYKFYQSSHPEIFFNSYQYTFFDANTNQLTIPWSYLHGANTYDFEWLFVDIGNNLETDAFEIDFKNATRVSTKQNFYKISMAYPRGYLIFRVRGVGLEESVLYSGNFDRRLEGQWSFGLEGTYAKQGPDIIDVNGPSYRKTNDFYFWDGLEPDKNWQYNVVYAEEGKRKEVIQFFDDILKPDQTTTLLNTDQSAVVAQNITDFVGRNSLQVLPAPQPSQGVRYYDPMHKNPSGTNYSYTDFDLDINSPGQGIIDPKRLSSFNNLGAGYYYSTTNTNPKGINGNYIPDAKGFPFSRTTYKNDGSGRVKEITGVGEEYHTGVERHKTRFFYSSPIQEVLFKLFGNEVGYAKYYEKTIVIDANGQASAAYKDLSGRVIATSLVGNAPDNLLDIDTKPATYETVTSNLSHLNGQQGEAMIINKTITVIGASQYTFEYTIPAAVFDSCGVTNDCKYDLEIYILDEYGVKVDLEYSRSTISEISRTNIDRVRATNPIRFSANLTTGSYQIIKELTLNQDALDAIVDDFMANQTCFLPEPWDSITTCNPGCDEICDNAYLSLPDRNGVQYYLSVDDGHRVAKVVNGAIQSPFIDPTGYQIVKDSIRACKVRCNNPPEFSECDLKYESLKIDMSPGGQYFDNTPNYYLADGVRLNPSYDRNGWLTSSSTRGNSYFAEIENCLNSKNSHGETTSQFWIDLRANWKPEYADILIKLHPEWCAFETLCCASSSCTGGSNSIIPTINSISITLSFQDSCMQLTPAERDTIKRQIAKIKTDSVNFNYLSAQALAELNSSGITDPDILAQFSPQALEDGVRDFYYEYFRYQRVKNQPCNNPNLYLDSPDENGITADGFQIIYPQNALFENFDPADPNKITNYISSQGCEQAATQMADDFMNKLKANAII